MVRKKRLLFFLSYVLAVLVITSTSVFLLVQSSNAAASPCEWDCIDSTDCHSDNWECEWFFCNGMFCASGISPYVICQRCVFQVGG